jgi:hypothetical protein
MYCYSLSTPEINTLTIRFSGSGDEKMNRFLSFLGKNQHKSRSMFSTLHNSIKYQAFIQIVYIFTYGRYPFADTEIK